MTRKTHADPAHTPLQPATRLVTAGRDPSAFHGFVNPPVYHASTVLYPTAEDFRARRSRYLYGRRGTPTSESLETAIRALEGPACAGVALAPSGLAAISLALWSALSAGDHVLVTDSVYLPTRKFCDGVLKRFGVSTTYYDPLIGSGISALMQPNTRAVFVEAPGSLSFEMQDVPAIAAAAHAKGALVLMDNTWASPLYFSALDKGVDLVDPGRHQIHRRAFRRDDWHGLRQQGSLAAARRHGACARQLRRPRRRLSRPARPAHVGRAARASAPVGSGRSRAGSNSARKSLRVLHPALPSDPGHAIWRRDFAGASSLFSIVLKPVGEAAVNAFLNELTLFGMGASWGGYESLAIPFDCASTRTATRWAPGGPTVRFHIGLEDINDLIGDLERGFAALAAASL